MNIITQKLIILIIKQKASDSLFSFGKQYNKQPCLSVLIMSATQSSDEDIFSFTNRNKYTQIKPLPTTSYTTGRPTLCPPHTSSSTGPRDTQPTHQLLNRPPGPSKPPQPTPDPRAQCKIFFWTLEPISIDGSPYTAEQAAQILGWPRNIEPIGTQFRQPARAAAPPAETSTPQAGVSESVLYFTSPGTEGPHRAPQESVCVTKLRLRVQISWIFTIFSWLRDQQSPGLIRQILVLLLIPVQVWSAASLWTKGFPQQREMWCPKSNRLGNQQHN